MIYYNHKWVKIQCWMLLLRAKYLLCHLHPYSKIRSHLFSIMQEGHCEKKWNPRWQPRLMAKFLITTIQVDLVPNPSEMWRMQPELSLLPLAYHHSHFLVATLDFASFSQWPSWGSHTYLQLGYFGLDWLFLWISYATVH